jgi:hypothetical protein
MHRHLSRKAVVSSTSERELDPDIPPSSSSTAVYITVRLTSEANVAGFLRNPRPFAAATSCGVHGDRLAGFGETRPHRRNPSTLKKPGHVTSSKGTKSGSWRRRRIGSHAHLQVLSFARCSPTLHVPEAPFGFYFPTFEEKHRHHGRGHTCRSDSGKSRPSGPDCLARQYAGGGSPIGCTA